MTASILVAIFSGMVALGLQLAILSVRAAIEEAQESACAMNSLPGAEGNDSAGSVPTNASKLSDIGITEKGA